MCRRTHQIYNFFRKDKYNRTYIYGAGHSSTGCMCAELRITTYSRILFTSDFVNINIHYDETK